MLTLVINKNMVSGTIEAVADPLQERLQLELLQVVLRKNTLVKSLISKSKVILPN